MVKAAALGQLSTDPNNPIPKSGNVISETEPQVAQAEEPIRGEPGQKANYTGA